MEDRRAHREELLGRLDAFLDSAALAAVWFGGSTNFAWLTGGSNVVDRASDPGVAAVGYDGTDLTVVTNNIEADRLATEELPNGVAVETYQWHGTALGDAVAANSPRPAAADFAVPDDGFERVDGARFRQPLTDGAMEAYRALGEDAARALESVCRDCSPTTTEREVAAMVRGRLTERGVDTPVALVGGDRRARTYRHFTPEDEPIGDYALLSVTARREGLHASCTRTLAFDPPSWLHERHRDAARVEVSALAATRSAAATQVDERDGDPATAGRVFTAIQDAYSELGHDGEWHHHHQGGAAGYAGREWIATPGHDAPVQAPMAYAWNPTVTGAKSEGTVLVTRDGFELLTTTGDWPTIEARAVDGKTTLPRPAVLTR